MISLNPVIASRKQSVQFGAWPAGSNPAALNALVDAIETKLETPPPVLPAVSESQRLEQYPLEARPRIQEIQEHLKKVKPNNGYGIELALDVLKLQEETGYQLTPEETDQFNILVNKSGSDLASALGNSRASSQQGLLERFLKTWLTNQTSYIPVKNMMAKAAAAPDFQMTPVVVEAFSQRLESLKAALSNPEVHAAQLKQLGNSFRPKFKLVDDLQKIFKVLIPAEGLFAEQTQQDLAQAMNLIAERNAKVNFAGKLANGNVYVFTGSTQSYEERFFVGAPGALQEVKMLTSYRARNGSDTFYGLDNGQSYRFLRGGLFDGDDLAKWSATVNDEVIPVEFPVFQLNK